MRRRWLIICLFTGLDLSSPLLPDHLPEGDPENYALPVFLEQPVSTYTSKEVTGNLSCRAAHATNLYFVCNEEKTNPTEEKDGLDEKTKSRYKEVRLELKRSQVMDVLDEFSCQCVAVSNQGEVVSNLVTVDVACKYFWTKIIKKNVIWRLCVNSPNEWDKGYIYWKGWIFIFNLKYYLMNDR